MLALATVDQPLTDVEAKIIFDTVTPGSYGNITKAGNDFTCVVGGSYIFILEPQVRQDKNNNVTGIWVKKNGVDVPWLGAVFETGNVNDNGVLSVTFAGPLQKGDVINFWGVTSLSLGSTLNAVAAVPPLPPMAACVLTILGFNTGVPA